LVSGFSPAIMKSILKANLKVETFTAESVMEQTIGSPRYNVIEDEASIIMPSAYGHAQAEKDWKTALQKRQQASG
jgi:hypothetical protein